MENKAPAFIIACLPKIANSSGTSGNPGHDSTTPLPFLVNRIVSKILRMCILDKNGSSLLLLLIQTETWQGVVKMVSRSQHQVQLGMDWRSSTELRRLTVKFAQELLLS